MGSFYDMQYMYYCWKILDVYKDTLFLQTIVHKTRIKTIFQVWTVNALMNCRANLKFNFQLIKAELKHYNIIFKLTFRLTSIILTYLKRYLIFVLCPNDRLKIPKRKRQNVSKEDFRAFGPLIFAQRGFCKQRKSNTEKEECKNIPCILIWL